MHKVSADQPPAQYYKYYKQSESAAVDQGWVSSESGDTRSPNQHGIFSYRPPSEPLGSDIGSYMQAAGAKFFQNLHHTESRDDVFGTHGS